MGTLVKNQNTEYYVDGCCFMDNRISLVKPIIRQKVLIVYHVENRTLCYRHYEDYGEPCNHTIFLPFVQGCVVYKDVEKPEWANTTRENVS